MTIPVYSDPMINGSFESSEIYGDDIMFVSSGSVTDTAAYPIVAIGPLELTVKVDGHDVQSVIFAGPETTAADIAAFLAATVDGATAYVSGGQVVLESLTTGPSSSIEVTGGAANAVLGFPTTAAYGQDSSFEGDGTDLWTPGAATALSLVPGKRTGGTGEQVLRVERTGVGNVRASQTITGLVVGEHFRLIGWARSDGQMQPRVWNDGTMWTGTTSTDWQEFDITFLSLDTEIRFYTTEAALGYFELDDLQLYQLVATHGGAEAWQWVSSQSLGGWAEFNSVGAKAGDYDNSGAFHLVDVHRQGVELFPADNDDNHLWKDALSEWTQNLAEFNAASPSYYGTMEGFEIWDGANWQDAWTYTAPVDELPTPTGFAGWYNTTHASPDASLAVENFEEDWDNYPYGTSYGWAPGTAYDGVLYGAALTFPLTIQGGRNTLDLFLQDVGGSTQNLYRLAVTAGTYASAAALAAELNTKLGTAMGGPATPWEFGTWTVGTDTGITFGWDVSTDVADDFLAWFGVVEGDEWEDVRGDIGLRSFDTRGGYNEVRYPVSLLSATPSGLTATDIILADAWSFVMFDTVVDGVAGTLMPLVYNQAVAQFDVAAPTAWEQFLVLYWAGAAWQAALGAVAAATFDAGEPEQDTIEQFIGGAPDGADRWPDEKITWS